MYSELGSVIVKCITEQTIDRNDEATLYNILAMVYGEDNILTELEINDDGKTVYFGCACRQDGKWKVYNLVGFGVGVVVKWGSRYRLSRRVG